MNMDKLLSEIDRDARYLHDMSKIRAERNDGTRDDVRCAEIALRHWQQVGELIEMMRSQS